MHSNRYERADVNCEVGCRPSATLQWLDMPKHFFSVRDVDVYCSSELFEPEVQQVGLRLATVPMKVKSNTLTSIGRVQALKDGG